MLIKCQDILYYLVSTNEIINFINHFLKLRDSSYKNFTQLILICEAKFIIMNN